MPARLPSLRPRIEYHVPASVPGLIHVGYDVFADAKPAGLREHAHAGAYEVCWIRRGSLRWQVGGRFFAVGPGDLFLAMPDERHGGRNGVMDRCELFWASFRLDLRRGSCGLAARECVAVDRGLRASPRRVCAGSAAVASHFVRLLGALADPGPLAAAVARSSMALLLATVRTAYAEGAGVEGRRCSPRIEQAKAWLAEHRAQPFTMDAVAAAVGLGAGQFRAVFRAETGFSPQEHLNQLRMELARDLLRDARRTITEVALACGFATSQYFATAFRRATGCTPGSWRRTGGDRRVLYL